MPIATASDAASLLVPLFARPRGEKLVVLHLDADRHAIAVAEYHPGALPLRAIVQAALERNAAGLIVAHNHPSGDLRPSPEDIDATRRLSRLAAELGIRLHDHLIFAGRSCSSFRALGLL
jgi:DNA repair protein RadC